MVVKYLQKPFFLAALICCFIFYSGNFKFPERSKFISLLNKNEINEITGIILNSPSKISSGNFYSAKFQIDKAKDYKQKQSSATGIISVYIPTEIVEAYFPGKLYSSGNNSEAYLYEAGGHYIFSGKFSNNNFYISKCKYNKWPENAFGKIDFFRALCRLQFKRLMFGWGKAGGLLLALLSGAKEYTDSSISENFRNSGLSHILALSGMHLSMFSSIAIFFGDKIGRKKITYILRIVFLILFVWFAGFSPSLLRAFICSCLSLLAVINGTKDPDLLLILCFSFLLQSIISPDDIYNLGFILSYGALTGILLFNKTIFKYLSKLIPGYFSASLSASISAQILTIPIALSQFGSFSPIGIIATTIVSPLITIFIYIGLLLICLTLIFPAFLSYSGIFINLMYTIIDFLVSKFSQFPKWSIN